MNIKMLGSSSIDRALLARSRRATRARTDLLRARGLAFAEPAPPIARDTPRSWFASATLPLRVATHACLCALVVLILAGELTGRWSVAATHSNASPLVTHGGPAPAPALDTLQFPIVIAPVRLDQPSLTQAAPTLQRPGKLVGAFQAFHPLDAGESLGMVAKRYGVSLASLVWANGLDQGDALIVGQILRIPRVSGLPYLVAEGETLEVIAERFGVTPGVIATFGPNAIGPDLHLRPGIELFIPGGSVAPSGEWLGAIGGIAGLANRAAEPAGVVREAQTNLRAGPSTAHPRLLRLEAGRRVALRARHEDWVKVELGAVLGWVRLDMLDVPLAWVTALPETNDFPAPPPRWVWPAQGSLTSRFGPRWGGFHNGLDIANRAWTPIMAARAGTVREAGWCSGYGYCVRIRHDGGVETIYGHLIERPLVTEGDEVAAGELIGRMGSTYDRAGGGYSTGVHLHFTVLVNGRAVNPLRFLP